MPAPRAPNAVARAVAPLISTVWILFLVWTFLVALVWSSGFGEVQVARFVKNPDLQAALRLVLRSLDAIWMTLGAASGYFALARAEGLPIARRWSAALLLATTALLLVNSATRWPLGPLHFPGNLGLKLGPVPFAAPLLWCVVIFGARDLAQRLLPRAPHAWTAVATGAAALLTDLNLEPLAWKWRAWWLWYPANLEPPANPPWQNYATWFCVAAVSAFLMRSPHVISRLAKRPPEPAVALLLINLICLLTHAVLFLRR